LPFEELSHLTNPLNDNKPVKVCRDGQEFSPAVGAQLCQMMDEGAKFAPPNLAATPQSKYDYFLSIIVIY